MTQLRIVPPPIGVVYRVGGIYGSSPMEVFDPPPWSTGFRGRFDDWRIRAGHPRQQCFRTIYFATQLAGAYGEVLQRHIRKAEDLEQIFADVHPSDPLLLGGQVTEDELAKYQVGTTQLDASLRFVDIWDVETRTTLHHTPEIASLVHQLGTRYLDISTISGDTREHRQLTQAIAVYVHDLTDVNGQPLYAGIRYMSRLNISWECWAVFHDRLRHYPTASQGSAQRVDPDDPELRHALSLLNIRKVNL